jgi:uncharacterized protein (DUF2235 family)
LGLWDTVSSVRYAWRDQHFPHTFDNQIVSKVRHAVALDERRAYFRQNLWKESADGRDVLQVWFPGVHCDVGGGYAEAESGLAKIALRWMIDEVGSALTFDSQALRMLLPGQDREGFAAPDAGAKMHESLRGLWHIVELIPKRVSVQGPDGSWTRRWIIPRGQRRRLADNARAHASVQERIDRKPDYRPSNLPGVRDATLSTSRQSR